MNEILVCINDQAGVYHRKLVGDSPECILKLIECEDENLMNHVLDLCGMYDSKKRQYTKGVTDDWDIVQPYLIIPYTLKQYDNKVQRVGSRKSGNCGLSGPGKQYKLDKGTQAHKLKIYPTSSSKANASHKPRFSVMEGATILTCNSGPT
jgi:hypothetical protein